LPRVGVSREGRFRPSPDRGTADAVGSEPLGLQRLDGLGLVGHGETFGLAAIVLGDLLLDVLDEFLAVKPPGPGIDTLCNRDRIAEER